MIIFNTYYEIIMFILPFAEPLRPLDHVVLTVRIRFKLSYIVLQIIIFFITENFTELTKIMGY